jgi:hypothetical protein
VIRRKARDRDLDRAGRVIGLDTVAAPSGSFKPNEEQKP